MHRSTYIHRSRKHGVSLAFVENQFGPGPAGALSFNVMAAVAQYQNTHPKFHRTAVSYILNNRFYVGEIRRGGNHYQGRHQPLIDRATFLMCQDILSGKNRRVRPQVVVPLSGGLLTCKHCGSFITGERINRKLKGGGVRVHDYYRCANNYPEDDHPTVRWRAGDLEDAIVADLSSFKLPDEETIEWFRIALQSAFTDITGLFRNQRSAQTKRRAELTTMNDRLLNAFLAGAISNPLQPGYGDRRSPIRRRSVSRDTDRGRLSVSSVSFRCHFKVICPPIGIIWTLISIIFGVIGITGDQRSARSLR